MQALIRCLKHLEEEGSSLHRKVPWKNKSQESGYLLNKSNNVGFLCCCVRNRVKLI